MWFRLFQRDSDWFNVIQQIQSDSMDSEWISLIKRDFSCMRRKPRPSMQPNIITYADFRIDKALWKKVQLVIVFHMKLCTPRKRSRTRGCLSQKLFTYGKVNFSGAFALRYSTIPSFYACRQFCPEVDLSGLCRPFGAVFVPWTNWRGTAGLYITNISQSRPIKI